MAAVYNPSTGEFASLDLRQSVTKKLQPPVAIICHLGKIYTCVSEIAPGPMTHCVFMLDSIGGTWTPLVKKTNSYVNGIIFMQDSLWVYGPFSSTISQCNLPFRIGIAYIDPNCLPLEQIKNDDSLTRPAKDAAKPKITHNPTMHSAWITIPGDWVGYFQISLISVKRQYMHSNIYTQNKVQLKLNCVPSGIYIIQIKDRSGHVFSKKIMIQ